MSIYLLTHTHAHTHTFGIYLSCSLHHETLLISFHLFLTEKMYKGERNLTKQGEGHWANTLPHPRCLCYLIGNLQEFIDVSPPFIDKLTESEWVSDLRSITQTLRIQVSFFLIKNKVKTKTQIHRKIDKVKRQRAMY